MRVAVYGGSFNPPHVGHAMVASWLLWTRRTDQVWLLPTFSHAFAKQLAPFPQRVAMCEALADAVSHDVSVCTIESELPAPSYTIDTLKALQGRHPQVVFQLVIGSDVLPELPAWRDWPTIAARWSPIVVRRAGYPGGGPSPEFPGVSSSEVRALLARGDRVDHLVPAAVLALLEDAP